MKGFFATVAVSYIAVVVVDHKLHQAAPEEYAALLTVLSDKAERWSERQRVKMEASADRIKTKAAFDRIVRGQ